MGRYKVPIHLHSVFNILWTVTLQFLRLFVDFLSFVDGHPSISGTLCGFSLFCGWSPFNFWDSLWIFSLLWMVTLQFLGLFVDCLSFVDDRP